MQVVHFLGTLKPGQDGVTRVLYRLREGFQKDTKIQHRYVSPILPETPMEGFYKVPSISTFVYPDYRIAICTPGMLRKMFGENKPDLLHIHSPCPLGLAAVLYGAQEGIPVVATYHTHFPSYLPFHGLDFLVKPAWAYLRWLYSHCDAVIVPSKTMLKDLADGGYKNLVHISHGVNPEGFSPEHRSQEWRNSISPNKDKVFFTFVGRLVWEKNLKALAEAYRLVKNKEKIQFVVVGDGPAYDKLKELMPTAHFTGYQGDKDLRRAYASSDVFIFPSVTETFGNVTVEAMASGLPAICAAAGGACDLVENGLNGLLVSPIETGKGFAEKIDFLVENPEVREKFSNAALKSVKKFSWETAVEQHLSLYPQLGGRKAAQLPKPLTSAHALGTQGHTGSITTRVDSE